MQLRMDEPKVKTLAPKNNIVSQDVNSRRQKGGNEGEQKKKSCVPVSRQSFIHVALYRSIHSWGHSVLC